ncbi:uncharacterized protein LOC129229511 [Uloborus diversus]|uniref:uncharacterized protein LOC129229511 n=1 Tax=Uloborus diversus TaxID=327109 RepID=UPI00240982F9|nr:uncharacterized protein LOC129229511 [Uloborus diversus]
MSIIIRLQNLPWSANSVDIRRYFSGLSIPEGGVHIVGGEMGDAFIAFSTDEDARLAMAKDGGKIKDMQIKLLLSSRTEMMRVIEQARTQNVIPVTPVLAPPPAPFMVMQPPARVPPPVVETNDRKRERSTSPHRRARDRSPPRDRYRSPDRRSSRRDRSRSPRSNRGSSRDTDRRNDRFKRDDRRYDESVRYRDDYRSNRDHPSEPKKYQDADHVNSRSQLHATEGFRTVAPTPYDAAPPSVPSQNYAYNAGHQPTVSKGYPPDSFAVPAANAPLSHSDRLGHPKQNTANAADPRNPPAPHIPGSQQPFDASSFEQMPPPSQGDSQAPPVGRRRKTRFEPEFVQPPTETRFPQTTVSSEESKVQYADKRMASQEYVSGPRNSWSREGEGPTEKATWNEKRPALLQAPSAKSEDFVQVVPMDLDPVPEGESEIQSFMPPKDVPQTSRTSSSFPGNAVRNDMPAPYPRTNAESKIENSRNNLGPRLETNKYPENISDGRSDALNAFPRPNVPPKIASSDRNEGPVPYPRANASPRNEDSDRGVDRRGPPRNDNVDRGINMRGPPRNEDLGRGTNMRGPPRNEDFDRGNNIRGPPRIEDTDRRANMRGPLRNEDMERGTSMRGPPRNDDLIRGADMRGPSRNEDVDNRMNMRGPPRDDEMGRGTPMRAPPRNEELNRGMNMRGPPRNEDMDRGTNMRGPPRAEDLNRGMRGPPRDEDMNRGMRGPPRGEDLNRGMRGPPRDEDLNRGMRGPPRDEDLNRGMRGPPRDEDLSRGMRGPRDEDLNRGMRGPPLDEDLERGPGKRVPSRFEQPPRGSPSLTVEIKGIPPTTRVEDILEFFHGIPLAANDIRVIANPQGAEKAVVRFVDSSHVKEAFSRNNRFHGGRFEMDMCPDDIFDSFLQNTNQSLPPQRHKPKPKPREEDLCIQLRGLPFQCKEEDIVLFFDGLRILDLFLAISPDGRAAGFGFVEFATHEDFRAALAMNGKMIGHRYITISVASKEMMEVAQADHDYAGPPESGPKMRPAMPPMAKPARPPPPCISLRGLPETVTNREIADFFNEVGVMPRAIHIMLTPEKKPSGDAFAELAGPQDVMAALKRDGNTVLGNPVEVTSISFREMSEILGRPLPPMPNPPTPGPLLKTPGDEDRPRRPFQGPNDGSFRERPRMEPPPRGMRPRMEPPMRRMEGPGRPPFNRMRGQFPPRPFGRGGPDSRFAPPPSSGMAKEFSSPGCVVSINNLHFRAGLEELLDFFHGFNVTKDTIIRKYNENGQATGEARVAFQSPREAQQAVRELNQKPIMGRQLQLSIL